ncbi:MAG: hypothetical protein HYR60_03325 [Acidobacteria bacterium]|nr:hypothetical protein [Acidobacteriota bacterium]
MKRTLWVFVILLAGTRLAAQLLPTPPRKQGEPTVRSIASVIALHDAKSKQYQANCLAAGCHADVFNRVSQNSTIPPAHNRVASMGIPAAQCAFCHENTEIARGIQKGRGNAAKLGKNVDAERHCYPCHSQYGPAKSLYAR